MFKKFKNCNMYYAPISLHLSHHFQEIAVTCFLPQAEFVNDASDPLQNFRESMHKIAEWGEAQEVENILP